jgi:hypothetical protein
LVGYAETVQVHSTIVGEDLRPKEIVTDEKSTWILSWQSMDDVLWYVEIWVRPTSKR